eukprot:CCRYP_003894-RA/>CCRYP_003894-RA protein AED:0.00 eAED:0.00 QI:171/-1/1/1/-1/1/1/2577/1135
MCTTNSNTKERRSLLRPPPGSHTGTATSAFSHPYSRPLFERANSDDSQNGKNAKSKQTMMIASQSFSGLVKIAMASTIGILLFVSLLLATLQRHSLPSGSVQLRGNSNPHEHEPMLDTATLQHPFDSIWPNDQLPQWAIKSPPAALFPPPHTIPLSKRTCLVHVGKTAGSTIGCQLGFNLHCPAADDDDTPRSIAPGRLPRYVTNMFHTNIYDCDDASTRYYLFVVRNPLERIQSAFAYDKPRDWGEFRRTMGDKYYWLRKRLYADCGFETLEDLAVRGLRNETTRRVMDGALVTTSEECKRRAVASLLGTEHFGCHFYYNYQYHYEGVPSNATIMTIRTEHIVRDWNAVEVELGGQTNILGLPEKGAVMQRNNVNTAKADSDKYLSEESRMVICKLLCNDIQVYKEILRRSVNLDVEQVAISIDELKHSCPIEAVATTCDTPKPDIRQKLLDSRGYQGQTQIRSPYEEHWQGEWPLPYKMTKDYAKYLRKTSPDKEVCFVHVGKTAGSTIACALGFNMPECRKANTATVAPGLLPQYTTKRFHCGLYDCFDDSAYYMFALRNPLVRFVSAFNYDMPLDWEAFRAQEGERQYNFLKKLFLDCPYRSVEEMVKLGIDEGYDGNITISNECRQRALGAIDGTGHYGTQMYYNYQYYAEGIPKGANVLVIRTEHLVDDWNSAESMVGGVTNILGPDQTTLVFTNVNGHSAPETKELSDESRFLLCEKLCNEIQVYKKILNVAVNLSEEQRQQSFEELKVSCPREAIAESCEVPLPDITTKLYRSRGYNEGIRLDAPQGEISIGRSLHPEPPSPYELTWPDLKLPFYMKKDREFAVESVPADKKTCFVHVGKTAGSTVGCAIGFNLHCSSKTIAPGVFPQYATNMFHSQMYDCHDDSAYFVFVVRNPLDRMISAFNYDNPSKDWEKFRQEYGQKHYNFRKKLYMDCPFTTFDELAQQGLSSHGNATEECRRRAAAAIDGTEHFGCHFFFNYQYHLEAVPHGSTIMTIRTEHLIEDWNSVEYNLGGQKKVLGPNQMVLSHNNVNTASGDKLKHLSDESRTLICEKLCNEIQMYKKILRNSINLSEEQVKESIIEEMMESCPVEAKSEQCKDPLPDITNKLVNSRGYLKKDDGISRMVPSS